MPWWSCGATASRSCFRRTSWSRPRNCAISCAIARGRKLVDGALADIKRTQTGHHLVIGFDGAPGAAAQLFADKRVVQKVDDYGQFAELELAPDARSEEHTSELQSQSNIVCRLLLEKKKRTP